MKNSTSIIFLMYLLYTAGQVTLLFGVFTMLLYVDNPEKVSVVKSFLCLLVGMSCIGLDAKVKKIQIPRNILIQTVYAFTGSMIIYSAVILQKTISGRTVTIFEIIVVVTAVIVLAWNICLRIRGFRGRS